MDELSAIVFEPEAHGTRVAYLENGNHISDLQIFDRWMWLGSAKVHVACIGGVGTTERSRNRGLARRVLNAAVEWMATRYDLSMLFGIPDFYGRFGYATCIPEHRVTLALRDIEAARPLLAHRPFVPEDRARMLELHAMRFAGSVGAFDHDAPWFEPRRRSSTYGRRATIRMFLDAGERLCGYLVLDDTLQQAAVSEMVGETAEVYETALALTAAAMRGRGLATTEVHLPLDDPFVVHARRYGLAANVHFPHERGGMMRVCDLKSTLTRLLPDLEQRMPREAPGLYLETDIGACALRRSGDHLELSEDSPGGLPTFRTSQRLLVTLLMGYRSVSEVATDPACALGPGALEVAVALFPLRTPFVPGPDRF